MTFYIFDLDNTICDRDSVELYPAFVAWLEHEKPEKIGIATNQGGVGLRVAMEAGGWGEPDKYPTQESVYGRLSEIDSSIYDLTEKEMPDFDQWGFPEIKYTRAISIACYTYQTKKGGWLNTPSDELIPMDYDIVHSWSCYDRKPNPGMLVRFLHMFDLLPSDCVFVGDMETDRMAAEQIGMPFVFASEFFKSF